jgi:hypothetical protein
MMRISGKTVPEERERALMDVSRLESERRVNRVERP